MENTQLEKKSYPTLKTCEVMQYWKYMDCNEVAVIISRIREMNNVKSWCIITHDKDILPSGEAKPPHFHAVITFSNSKTIDSISKAVHVEPQYVNKIRTSTKSAQLYLVHRNNPEKYQYDVNEVRASFDYVNFVDDCPVREKRENIAQRIASGEIKEYNIFQHITVDEYSKNKTYYKNCFEYRQGYLKGLNRNMECIFITGASGTGKTTYAKMIAQNYGYNTYISSGGKNPLDNYKGEECVILDDTRSSTWSLTDFLKLTDNHTDSLVGCRYYNKSIAECKLLIVTSCKSLSQFYDNAMKEDDEPRKQLYRRFGLYIKMFDDDMNIATYNNERDGFVHSLTTANPVSLMRQNTERSRQRVQSFIECMGIKEAPQDYVEHNVDDELPF